MSAAARRVGLSTPAMSHALARLRASLGDPLLVRSGRGMVLTPRAESLKPRVHAVVTEARRALAPEEPFSLAALDRDFTVFATDYVLGVLGAAVDRAVSDRAPHARIRFVPNTSDDAPLLRDGGGDMAVGIYGELPQEMRSRKLLTDRFVCVVREGHPVVGRSLTLEKFVALPHLQIAPRGKPGGYIDDELRARGLARRVARAVPYFFSALQLASRTDYVLTVSERLATQFAPALGLRVFAPPIELRPYALSLVWHPRNDGDEAHRFVRDCFVRAARETAGDVHPHTRTRLDPSDPTSGQARRRVRRPQ